MSTALFDRGTETEMNLIPITDGLVYFCTSNNRIYMDNGSTRLQYGGDTVLISNTAQASSDNAFSASATINLFPQKTNIVDDKASALSVTQPHIPLGCLAFKQAIGTQNYSGISDGTLSGAVVQINSTANSASMGVSALNNQLRANGTSIYMDYKNGRYGYNTSANRGADTFHPFSSFAGRVVKNECDTNTEYETTHSYTASEAGYYLLYIYVTSTDGTQGYNTVSNFNSIEFDNCPITGFSGMGFIRIGWLNQGSTLSVTMTAIGHNHSKTMTVVKFE